ncbi:MAG TPA: sulfatase-like hydrolase/transferase [Acidimicrobiales bacterium]|nr:sulfatase-like hydrolase/transferase [Acidimicrobiales bacterium]
MSRPNIVVFIPDQLRYDALGCSGNPVASTPNIDALAARGTRFANAFGQHPFCSQSRVSFLTGWYPHVHGHRTLTQLIKPWHPDSLGLLKASGYHVAHAGIRGDTYAPGGTKASTSRFGWTEMPEALYSRSPYGPDHRFGRAFYHGQRPEPLVDMDEATVRTALAWLAEGLPEPWVLYVPLVFPHPPFEVADPWYSLHDRADVPLPVAPPTSTDGEPVFKREIRARYGLDRLDEAEWRELVATYYGMVSRVDDMLGRVLGGVAAAGAEDRTAVLFFPDHGEYLGDHGLIEKWVSGQDECLLHNPLIVHVPGGREGQVAEGMAELIDVAPTLLELGEVDVPHRQFGRSLVHLAHDATADHRDIACSDGGLALEDASSSGPQPFPYDLKHGLEREVPLTAGKVSTLRTDRWTYVHRSHEGPELYDRIADPHETRNLAGDDAHAAVADELRGRLLSWLVETADVIGPTDPRNDLDGAQLPDAAWELFARLLPKEYFSKADDD